MIQTFEKYYSTIDEIVENVKKEERKDTISPLSNVLININKYHAFFENKYRYDFSFVERLRTNEKLGRMVDIDYSFLLNDLIRVNDQNKDAGPFIFCSFRYGPFYHMPAALKKRGYTFDVVADVIKPEHILSWEGKDHSAEGYDDVFAEKNIASRGLDTLLSIYKSIKKGRSVLLYIDLSPLDKDNKGKMIPLDIMNIRAFFDKSIFEISKKLKVRIVPVISQWTRTFKIDVNICESINYDFDKNDYSVYCGQKCFEYLNYFLSSDASQWFGWSYLHRMMDVKGISPRRSKKGISGFRKFRIQLHPKLSFRHDDFELGKDDKFYVVSVNTYKSFEFTESVFNIIEMIVNKGFVEEKIVKKLLPQDAFKKLIRNKILIYS